MKNAFVSGLVIISLLFSTVAAAAEGLRIKADRISSVTEEVTVVRPYRADTEKVKKELEFYRWTYIPFALFQGYVLIGAVVRR